MIKFILGFWAGALAFSIIYAFIEVYWQFKKRGGEHGETKRKN
jgi:hypothetical protein